VILQPTGSSATWPMTTIVSPLTLSRRWDEKPGPRTTISPSGAAEVGVASSATAASASPATTGQRFRRFASPIVDIPAIRNRW
jgi:hypothetical protein